MGGGWGGGMHTLTIVIANLRNEVHKTRCPQNKVSKSRRVNHRVEITYEREREEEKSSSKNEGKTRVDIPSNSS